MKSVLTIIKKEFARFFKDTRLWITALILPGLLIFAMYNIMGTIFENVEKNEAGERCAVYISDMPDTDNLKQSFLLAFAIKTDFTDETAKAAVKNGSLDLYVVFPENFDEAVKDYEVSSGAAAPNVNIYFNSASSKSVTAYSMTTALLSSYEETLVNKFDINADVNGIYDLADAQSTSKSILSMIVPMILLMLLFSGCMAVAPESIAGEKERGTIATLLVTPVKRSVVAVGKIVALSVIALLSGLSSALGMMLSLPKLAGSASGISLSMYGFGDYAVILAVVLSTVLVIVTLISIISAYAKSVKEANGLVVPLMIVVMLCGVFSMFAGAVASLGLYFIPLFNSALVISTVLSGTVSPFAPLITVCVNVVFAALLVFVLTRMFNSEKIMFNR